MTFPTSLDALANPTGASDLDTPAVLHSAQHANVNDAVEALEAKVGVDGSAVTSSLDYKTQPKNIAAAVLLRGTLAARPAAASANAGLYYLATDDNGGTLYRSTGAAWEQVAAAVTHAHAFALDDLSDVDTTSTPPADGDRLAFDNASGLWLPTAASAGMLAFDDLTDVDLTGAADGDVPTLSSGVWVASAPSGASGAGAHFLDIPLLVADETNVGTWAAAIDGGQPGGFYIRNSTIAQNDTLNLGNVQFDAGTYKFVFFGTTGPDQAIVTLLIDDVSVGTVDTYSGSTTYATTKTISGVTIASAGAHTVKVKLATKNASSSAYFIRLTLLRIRRTA